METFGKYNSDIVRAEYRHVLPESNLNLNSVNKKNTFRIDYNDNFATKSFQYYITGVQNNGIDYAANVELIDNFIPHFFTHIELRKLNKLLEEVDYPGICSTVKDTVSYSLDGHGPTINSGFQSRLKGGKYFSALGSLASLGLGFFTNVNARIYKGGFGIIFTINQDNDALYRWKTLKDDGSLDDATLPVVGKVVINDFTFECLSQTTKIQQKFSWSTNFKRLVPRVNTY